MKSYKRFCHLGMKINGKEVLVSLLREDAATNLKERERV
jgi:hypothetical protein